MKQKCFLLFGVFSIFILFSGCNSNHTQDSNRTENPIRTDEPIHTEDSKYNNKIFTEDMLDSVIEIDYWVGNRKLSVEDKDKIKEFCTSLSALKLEEVTFSEKGTEKEGHLCVDLITKDETISLGLLTHEIAIDSKTYSTDQDITKVLRNIFDE